MMLFPRRCYSYLGTLSKAVDVSEAIAFRAKCRSGEFTGTTSGHCMEYVQNNVVSVPKKHAYDFMLLGSRNPKGFPFIEVLDPGSYTPKMLSRGSDIDLRTDLPNYLIFKNG